MSNVYAVMEDLEFDRDDIAQAVIQSVWTTADVIKSFPNVPQSTLYRILKSCKTVRRSGGTYLYVRWEVLDLIAEYVG